MYLNLWSNSLGGGGGVKKSLQDPHNILQISGVIFSQQSLLS